MMNRLLRLLDAFSWGVALASIVATVLVAVAILGIAFGRFLITTLGGGVP